MKFCKLLVLFLSFSAGVHKTTHAQLVGVKGKYETDNKNKVNRTVIELHKDITVNTGLKLDIPLTQFNNTEAFNIPKVRKVTLVDNDSLERKLLNATESQIVSTKAVKSFQGNNILTEGGTVDIKPTTENATGNTFIKFTKKEENKTATSIDNNKNNSILAADAKLVRKQKVNTNITAAATTTARPLSVTSTITTTKPIPSVKSNFTTTNSSSTAKITYSTSNSNSSSSYMSSTTPTTTTTTTTTTPKPKKPTITYSVPDFPDLEKDNPELKNLLQLSSSNKLPIPDVPYAQPSQEFNGNFHRGRDFILPIVSMIFIIPLVIGIIITSYRRFRDCWSTRHYRRMDFLVDGMYND